LWVYRFLRASRRFRQAVTITAVLAAVVAAVGDFVAGGAVQNVVLFAAVAFSAVMFFSWRLHTALGGLERLKHE
jgi:hypothetical protein